MLELNCKNLTLGYDGRAIVENLNFTLESGDYLGIIGENGAGKSTLMRTILSLQKPLSGEIEYMNGLTASEIGYIPQQTDAQKDFPASVYEVVLSGCLNSLGFKPFYSKVHKQTALNNMKLLGIEGLAKRCYRELSGGQQQRVLLARALCATKKMLLLDEPVAGLDPVVTAELYEIIEKLNKEHKITVIMISHDLNAALNYASHVLYVSKNSFFGTKEQFLNSQFAERFLLKKEGI